MKVRKGYVPTDAVYPLQGLDVLTPSPQLDNNSSPDLKNIVIQKGIVSKRYGYTQLGGTLTDPVMLLVEFEDLTATKTLLAITTKKQYKYNTSTGAWDNITYQSAGVDVDLTGDETYPMDYLIVTGLDGSSNIKKWFIFTNGKDQPRYWDGAASKFALWNNDYPDFVTCQTLSFIAGHIVMGNVTTTISQKQLIVWSDAGKLLDFTGTQSGELLMADADGSIKKLEPLGDRLFAYCDNSINMLSYIGGELIFTQERVALQTRLVSQKAIANIGPYHLFLSEEDVYLFNGTSLTRRLGEKISNKYKEELFVNLKYKAFAFHDAPKQVVYFGVPISSSQTALYKYEYDTYDLSQSKWSRDELTDRPISMGYFSRDVTLTWDSDALLNISWATADFSWNQGSVRAGFPVKVVGGSGKAFLADETLRADDDTAYESYYDTRDFVVPGEYESSLARWLEIELDLKGFEAEILISTDQGQTFKTITNLFLTTRWKKYKIPIDEMSANLRVRVRNECTGSSFYLRWLRVWYRPGGVA